jgi:uncharacterized RDD family membrane protein YckC
MKCPGCGYTTADRTQRCPRCGRLLVYRRDGAVGGLKAKGSRHKKGIIFSAQHGFIRLRREIADFRRAGFFIRGVALFFDFFFVVMLTGAILCGGALILGTATGVLESILKSRGMEFIAELLPYAKAAIITVVAVPMLYSIVMHTLFGQTIGKMIVGIQVLRSDGRPVGILSATVRFFGAIISGLLLGVGFLWVLWDQERQGWHDMLADTVVIKL